MVDATGATCYTEGHETCFDSLREDMQMNISDIIRQAREGLGLTQEDLAEKLEVSRQAVSK